mgnify:CR=1 FL=1
MGLLDQPSRSGYTDGMKTAVSLPDDLFIAVERLARHSGRRRSEVYAAALREYVARHAPDHVTESLDRVIAEAGDSREESAFAARAADQVLRASEW